MSERHPGLAFSALERAPRRSPPEPRAARRPARWPWWLDPLAIVALAVVVAYRALVPIAWRRRCIYTPSCSAYGLASLTRYGGLRGVRYTLARLRRCDGSRFDGGEDPP
ncbi:MAG: membrane protein insertion efficiency factor YidD [Myxococcota bacterium]